MNEEIETQLVKLLSRVNDGLGSVGPAGEEMLAALSVAYRAQGAVEALVCLSVIGVIGAGWRAFGPRLIRAAKEGDDPGSVIALGFGGLLSVFGMIIPLVHLPNAVTKLVSPLGYALAKFIN